MKRLFLIATLFLICFANNASALTYMEFESDSTAWGVWSTHDHGTFGSGYATYSTTKYFENEKSLYQYCTGTDSSVYGGHYNDHSLAFSKDNYNILYNISWWATNLFRTDNEYCNLAYRQIYVYEDTDNNITNGYEYCESAYYGSVGYPPCGNYLNPPPHHYETGEDGNSWGVWVMEFTKPMINDTKILLRAYASGQQTTNTVYHYIDKITFNDITTAPAYANTTINLYDDCGNLLQNATTTIFKDMTTQIYQGNDNPITINEVGNYDRYDQLKVIIDTHDMAVEKTVYADEEFNIFNLVHNFVDWDLQVFVYDNYTKDAIEEVKVISHQDCRIAGTALSRYSLTNGYGFIVTHEMSNQNFSISTYHVDYGNHEENFIADFDAWNGFYYVDIYLNNVSQGGGGEAGLPELPCSTAWSNDSNVIITEINDSQNARLHYMAGNCTTLLYLERWSESIDMWIMIGSSITLDPLQTGYVQYTSANWTEDETTIYRGRLWALNCYCDDTSTLKVWNSSDDNITIYTNLTASTRFCNKVSGLYVNPGIPIKIKSYAASNNTSLCTIDLKLYNESTLVDTESLTFFDWYVSGYFQPYYWYPNYDYADGFNYTIRMYGLNGALLDIDHVFSNASSENPYNTLNTLIVYVKDENYNGIPYSTVFVEGWGSQATGSDFVAQISGLQDGDTQYKATKSGYTSSVWNTVTLDGADETVTCILVEETDERVTGYKLRDSAIKAFFVPLFYLLLIIMLIGAVMYANQK